MANHENVMLLSMSILPRTKSINTYKGITEEGQEYYFKGISQLEAHSKYVAKILDDKGEKIDRFVILSTNEANDYNSNYQISAVDLYKIRMTEYLKNYMEKCNIEGTYQGKEIILSDIVDAHQEEKETILLNSYDKIVFCDVKLDETTFFLDAVNKITDFQKDKEVHLYMDMQGGDRNVIAQMNAIVNLLDKSVKIFGRYANDFKQGTDAVWNISEVSDKYRTYELITAMDSFKRYGRGDGLVEYFRDKKKEDEKAKALTEAIKNASDAIQFCDVDGFDKAINEIAALYEKFVSVSDTNKTEMDVIYEDIYRDYEPLIKAEHRYVEQIRWCIKKKFFQQALTIFEAKMPNEYVVSGLKYYCNSEDEIKGVMEKFENIYFKFYTLQEKTDENGNKIPNKEAYKMKYINHFFICDYYFVQGKLCEEEKIPVYYGIESKKVKNSLSHYRKIREKRNHVNHVASVHNEEGFFCNMARNYKYDNNWKSSPEQMGEVISEIETFLENFCELAKEAENVKSIDLE